MSDDYYAYWNAARRLSEAESKGDEHAPSRDLLKKLAHESDSAMVRILCRLRLSRPVDFRDYLGN